MTNILVSQTDFGGGQVDNAARRRDDTPSVRTGAAVMTNWRSLSTGQLVPRPGRRPLFDCQGGRTDRFRMAPNVEVLISFSAGAVAITGLDGTTASKADGTPAAAASPAYVWTDAGLPQINLTQALNDIMVCYPGMRPQILRWERSTNTWSFLQFAFATVGQQIYEPFYRYTALGASMSYNGTTGQVTLTCSMSYFLKTMLGAALSIVGQQATIVQILSPTQAVVVPGYRLPGIISVPVADVTPFIAGQIVENTGTPQYKFEVGAISTSSGPGTVSGPILSSVTVPSGLPGPGDVLTSPIGTASTTAAPSAVAAGAPTLQWAEELMSDRVGWPAASFYDNQRLGFCDFPQLSEAVLWSQTNKTDSFWIDSVAARLQPEAGASDDSAFLELIAGRPRVRHVVGWGDEFVFTDRGIYQVPVSTSNPLKPGSVEFRQFSNDGVSEIRPITTQDSIVYINAGLRRCSCVRATGSYTRPYVSDDLSNDHSDLFDAPFAMGIATGDGAYPERYVYLVMADNSVVMGRFTSDKKFVGFRPWTSANSVTWITSSGPTLYYTSRYAGGQTFLELEDDAAPFDAAIAVNAPPTNLALVGLGPLWPLAGQTVTLMDGNRDRGERQVDAAGNLLAIEGEDVLSPTLLAGLFTPCDLQPFTPAGQQGADGRQRALRRNIVRGIATVQNHSGFRFDTRLFPVDAFGEDATAQPALKSGTYRVRTMGRDFDPTIDLVKERPGPMTVCEIALEVTP